MNPAIEEDCRSFGKFLLRGRMVEEASSLSELMWVEASSTLANQDTQSIGSPRTKLKFTLRISPDSLLLALQADLDDSINIRSIHVRPLIRQNDIGRVSEVLLLVQG